VDTESIELELHQHREVIIQRWNANASTRRWSVVAGFLIPFIPGLILAAASQTLLAAMVIGFSLILGAILWSGIHKEEREFQRWTDNPDAPNPSGQANAVRMLYLVQTPQKARGQHAMKLTLFVMMPLLFFPIVFALVALPLRALFSEVPNLLIIALTFVSWALTIRLWNRVGPRLLK
jgi:hypothetical protein